VGMSIRTSKELQIKNVINHPGATGKGKNNGYFCAGGDRLGEGGRKGRLTKEQRYTSEVSLDEGLSLRRWVRREEIIYGRKKFLLR